MSSVSAGAFVDSLTRLGVSKLVAEEALNYPINAYRDMLETNNCYSWGVGDLFLHALSYNEMQANDYVQWIGDASGVRRPVWDIFEMSYKVQEYLAEDGLYFVSTDTPALPDTGFTQIFVASDIRGYGYVYHQNSLDGLWSHKEGVCKFVTGYKNVAKKPQLIENPYKSFRDGYNLPIGFFQIQTGRQIGIKAYENKLADRNMGCFADEYIHKTQTFRDKCKEMNIRASKLDKVIGGFDNAEFNAIYGEYKIIRDDFESVYKKYKPVVNRHNLLKIEHLRNQSQFMY